MYRVFSNRVCEFVSVLSQYTSSGESLPKLELTRNMCAVCGQRIVLPSEDREVAERTYKLTCNHLYPTLHNIFIIFVGAIFSPQN